VTYAGAMPRECTHTGEIREVVPSADGCEDCLRIGDDWVHLRLCLTCGHVGCCDSSRNRHAATHAAGEEHPVVQAYQPGESWRWCYVDRVYL
jgi:Zn-finger in ubiquitin-hydrolases and other protein